MYEYDYSYTTEGLETLPNILGIISVISGIIMIISLIVSIILIISQWKIYKKAGKNGWESIIPIYNFIVLLQIVELPMWYIALLFVPFANIYAIFKIYIKLAHKFGKSTGFGVLTVFFNIICFPILAFSKNCVYQGNNNQNMEQSQMPEPNQQPITFNQNINTMVQPTNTLGFEPMAPINNQTINNMSNQNDTPVQEINFVPVMQNQSNNSQNVVNTPQMNMNQPITFNPGLQTNNTMSEVNVIPANNNEPLGNNTNSLLQQPSNQQSQLNVIPGMDNQPITPPQPINPQNIINTPQMNMNQPITFNPGLQTNNNEPLGNNTNSLLQQPSNQQSQLNVIPGMDNQPTTFNQQPSNNAPMQTINVIPTLGTTPTIQNTNNNQNM